MSAAPIPSKLAVVPEGEPTLFDSLARLVPEELQTAYYRVLAHTRTLSPDDEMLRILEAMGILALLTRHTPKDIADERERFQEMLELHRQFSDEAQQKMLGYVRELESRISELPREIKAGLDPEQIAKMLGESLRQHFLQSGISETVKGLQATSAAMTSFTEGTHNGIAQSIGFTWRRCCSGGICQQPIDVFPGEPGERRWTRSCMNGKAICCASGFRWLLGLRCWSGCLAESRYRAAGIRFRRRHNADAGQGAPAPTLQQNQSGSSGGNSQNRIISGATEARR